MKRKSVRGGSWFRAVFIHHEPPSQLPTAGFLQPVSDSFERRASEINRSGKACARMRPFDLRKLSAHASWNGKAAIYGSFMNIGKDWNLRSWIFYHCPLLFHLSRIRLNEVKLQAAAVFGETFGTFNWRMGI